MRQRAKSRLAVLNWSRRTRSFDNRSAACAGELRSHICRITLKVARMRSNLLRYIFAELSQCTTAIRTARVSRQKSDDLTRKVFRQRLACRARTGLGCCPSGMLLCSFRGRLCRLQFLQPKLKMFELACQLRLLLEKNIRRYISMTIFTCSICLVFDRCYSGQLAVLRHDQRLQCFDHRAHRESARLRNHGSFSTGLRPDEASSLRTLEEKIEDVTIKPKKLNHVTSSACEKQRRDRRTAIVAASSEPAH
jgi:hypothetical protein